MSDHSKMEQTVSRRLSRRTPMGRVAAARFPGLGDRKTMADGIRAQDADLITGSLEPVVYKPLSMCGLELKLEPLSPALGTVIHGLDLERHMDLPGMVTFLRELWLERRVIMFRNQEHLTHDGMIQFAEYFGELGAHHGERDHVPSSSATPENYPDILRLQSGEKTAGAASEWHSDATWSSRPPMGSVLICREAPPIGGDTNFCDAYALWEGLRMETKERVASLKALHVGQPFHAMDGQIPSAVHPVARTHPETGRTALFVNRVFTRGFSKEHEIEEAETRILLRELFSNIGRPEVSCRFRWAPGSIAMWDNRAVQHCASGDFWPHRRLMERVTILDYEPDRRTPFFAE